MSTKKTLSLLLGLLTLTAIAFLVLSNSAVPTQGVQAESINAVVMRPYQDSVTTVPTTHSYPLDTTIVRPNIAAHSARPDACRTWVVGGYDATDGIPCGTTVEKQHKDKDNPVITTVVPPQDNPNPPVVDTNTPKAKHCNKGSGNGAEGCDPGNHPENGNNDEGGDKHPANSKGGRRTNSHADNA